VSLLAFGPLRERGPSSVSVWVNADAVGGVFVRGIFAGFCSGAVGGAAAACSPMLKELVGYVTCSAEASEALGEVVRVEAETFTHVAAGEGESRSRSCQIRPTRKRRV
jgi:hypothetical protein